MSEQKISKQLTGWGVPITRVLCPVCDWSFLVIGDVSQVGHRCPHCFQGTLESLDLEQDQVPFQHTPELVITPTVTAVKIASEIEEFSGKIPFPPNDLNPEKLHQRLRLIYLPVWLVDCRVSTIWDAETGFNYDVVSHQERFSESRWTTQEVEETRVRWEPRIGRLERTYENVSAPALQDHTRIWRRLGPYRVSLAQPYAAEKVINTLMRLPDQYPEAVWPGVKPVIQKQGAVEVKKAANADYIRSIRWAPHYQDKVWTLLLAPVYATYYTDDNDQPQPVLIHAQSGQVDGMRRSSMKRAQRLSLILAIVALVGFVLSLALGAIGLVLPPLLLIAILGGLISVGVGVGAFLPMIRSWRFNLRNEK